MHDTFGDPVPPGLSRLDQDCARRVPDKHHLVAHLSGGLRSTYAPESETEVVDVFAALIARLTDATQA